MAADSESPPPELSRDWAHLIITGIQDVSSILTELDHDTSLTGRIHTIEIILDLTESEIGDYYQFRKDDENTALGIELEAKIEKFTRGIGEIIQRIVSAASQEISARTAPTPGLRSFIWYSDLAYAEIKTARPAEFWNALAASASTLEFLSLAFYVHELSCLEEKGIDPFPEAPEAVAVSGENRWAEQKHLILPQLQHLYLDLSGGHGDNAACIEKLLAWPPGLSDSEAEESSISDRGGRALISLGLDVPRCDLQGCRLQGLSYGWTFPRLRRLFVRGYLDDPSTFEALLERNSDIEMISLAVETDEGSYALSSHTLPRLQALEIEKLIGPADGSGSGNVRLAISLGGIKVDNMDTALTAFTIEEQRVDERDSKQDASEETSSLEISDTGARALRRLVTQTPSFAAQKAGFLASISLLSTTLRELDIESYHWAEDKHFTALAELFPRLTELREFGLRSYSGSCYISSRSDSDESDNEVAEEEGGEDRMNGVEGGPGKDVVDSDRHPAAPTSGTLLSILRAFPSDSKIEALFVSDERSKPLSSEFLSKLDPSAVPRSLKYLVWGHSGNGDKTGIIEKKTYKVERAEGTAIKLIEREDLPWNDELTGVPEKWAGVFRPTSL